MTSIEKAGELVDKFWKVKGIDLPQAYRCALICIEEIKSMAVWVSKECQEKEGFNPDCTEEFWIEAQTMLEEEYRNNIKDR